MLSEFKVHLKCPSSGSVGGGLAIIIMLPVGGCVGRGRAL